MCLKFIVVSFTFELVADERCCCCCLDKGDLPLGRSVRGKCCGTCLFVEDLVGRVNFVIMPLVGLLNRIRFGWVDVDGVMDDGVIEKEVMVFINEVLRLGMIMGLGFEEEGKAYFSFLK